MHAIRGYKFEWSIYIGHWNGKIYAKILYLKLRSELAWLQVIVSDILSLIISDISGMTHYSVDAGALSWGCYFSLNSKGEANSICGRELRTITFACAFSSTSKLWVIYNKLPSCLKRTEKYSIFHVAWVRKTSESAFIWTKKVEDEFETKMRCKVRAMNSSNFRIKSGKLWEL